MRTIMRYPGRILLLLLLSITATTIQAQENLKILPIFEKYGKQKGSIMTVYSGDALKSYRLHSYRSITVRYNNAMLEEIQQSLEADKHQAREIKEVINDGIITSGYYQLPEQEIRMNRYILFKIGNDGTFTLIYMEGGDDSEEMIRNMFLRRK